MRSTPILALPLLLTLACSSEDSTLAAQHGSPRARAQSSPSPGLADPPGSAPAPSASAPAPESSPSSTSTEALAEDPTGPGLLADPEAPAGASEAAPAPDPGADPLAPLLPEGPEPGSPEADAELEALLEESTLTQEEFDQAFRSKGGPQLEGDQFVFGPRTRGEPTLEVGAATGGQAASRTALEALVRAEKRKVLGCYTMALSDDPDAGGRVTLRLSFDAEGGVRQATAEGGERLGEAMKTCLVAIALGWVLTEAGDASLAVELNLATAS